LEREIKKYAQEEQGVRVSVCLLLVEQKKKYKKKKLRAKDLLRANPTRLNPRLPMTKA